MDQIQWQASVGLLQASDAGGVMCGLKGEVGVNWNGKSDSTAVVSSEGDCKERMPGPANSQARHLFSDSVLSLSTQRPAEIGWSASSAPRD